VTHAQQSDVGSDWYTWEHSGNPNPDLEHLAVDGKRFRWSKRPSFGHPGDRRHCGCRAIPWLRPSDIKRLKAEHAPPRPEPEPAAKPAKPAKVPAPKPAKAPAPKPAKARPGSLLGTRWPKGKDDTPDEIRHEVLASGGQYHEKIKGLGDGLSDDERHHALLSLVSLAPGEMSHAKITGSLDRDTGRIKLTISGVTREDGDVERTVFQDENGEWVLDNFVLTLGAEGKPTKFAKGTGTRALARQVEAAQRLGIRRITTEAAGNKNDVKNGYYTWPRLGYDGPIPDGIKVPPAFGKPALVSELMATQEGRDWWKAHGHTFGASFDTTPGSRSMRVLEAYRKETGR
jgi:hypothetical protein